MGPPHTREARQSVGGVVDVAVGVVPAPARLVYNKICEKRRNELSQAAQSTPTSTLTELSSEPAKMCAHNTKNNKAYFWERQMAKTNSSISDPQQLAEATRATTTTSKTTTATLQLMLSVQK